MCVSVSIYIYIYIKVKRENIYIRDITNIYQVAPRGIEKMMGISFKGFKSLPKGKIL